MHVKNSLISGYSPSNVIPNMSASFAVLQRKSFCNSWDFGSYVISGEVDKLSTVVNIFSYGEIKIPAVFRI